MAINRVMMSKVMKLWVMVRWPQRRLMKREIGLKVLPMVDFGRSMSGRVVATSMTMILVWDWKILMPLSDDRMAVIRVPPARWLGSFIWIIMFDFVLCPWWKSTKKSRLYSFLNAARGCQIRNRMNSLLVNYGCLDILDCGAFSSTLLFGKAQTVFCSFWIWQPLFAKMNKARGHERYNLQIILTITTFRKAFAYYLFAVWGFLAGFPGLRLIRWSMAFG